MLQPLELWYYYKHSQSRPTTMVFLLSCWYLYAQFYLQSLLLSMPVQKSERMTSAKKSDSGTSKNKSYRLNARSSERMSAMRSALYLSRCEGSEGRMNCDNEKKTDKTTQGASKRKQTSATRQEAILQS